MSKLAILPHQKLALEYLLKGQKFTDADEVILHRMTVRLGEAVLGWKERTYKGNVANPKDGGQAWKPFEYIKDAMFLAEKLPGLILERAVRNGKKVWVASFEPNIIESVGLTPQSAISFAAYETLDEEE